MVKRRKHSFRPKHYSRKKPKTLHLKAGADAGLHKTFSEIGVPQSPPFTPDAFQTKALAAIKHSDCLVTAPTGAGKTWIAERAIARIHAGNGKSWYACPLKALSNAKYAEFSAIFGQRHVGILTGDRKENPDASIIVGTTEILRNQLYDAMHRGEVLAADFVVLDEAHFLGDADRGVVWEEIMIYLPTRIPLLLLSATIGNADQIASWLSSIRSSRCEVIKETKRPVPLVPVFLHPSGTLLPLTERANTAAKETISKKVNHFLKAKHRKQRRLSRELPPFDQVLRVLKKFHLLPALFFLKSRADCDRALELCRLGLQIDPDRKSRLKERIEPYTYHSHHIFNHRQRWFLENLAIGSHHAGQLPAWKLILERLMTEGLLDAVFATSTVAAGVNFPAPVSAPGRHPISPDDRPGRSQRHGQYWFCAAAARQIHGCASNGEAVSLNRPGCRQPDQNKFFHGAQFTAVAQSGSNQGFAQAVVCSVFNPQGSQKKGPPGQPKGPAA
jgi:superfamily II RNA helicase